ncbi:hypothetical protein Tco_0322290 [Tanacetum coccineum]
MGMIHVKFDEFTVMASECNNSELEYYATSIPEVSNNSAANTHDNQETSSSSSIVIEEDESPQIVSSSKEPVTTESYTLFGEAESSSNYQDPSNMHKFHQQHRYTDKWSKNYLIEQVIGDPSKPVQTRKRLRTGAELCMYTLIGSLTEPKNIKEAMFDHSWIESMQDELNQFKRLDVWELVPLLEGRLAIKMKFFLGLEIHQSPRGIFINQSQYTMELLRKHGMEKFDTVTTLMATAKINADLQGTPTDQTKYRSMIGGLMYLIASRPDISFVIFECARYQARPTEKHLKEVKRIFRYLIQSINKGLWYSIDSVFELIEYSDADLAGCLDDYKSTAG